LTSRSCRRLSYRAATAATNAGGSPPASPDTMIKLLNLTHTTDSFLFRGGPPVRIHLSAAEIPHHRFRRRFHGLDVRVARPARVYRRERWTAGRSASVRKASTRSPRRRSLAVLASCGERAGPLNACLRRLFERSGSSRSMRLPGPGYLRVTGIGASRLRSIAEPIAR
jgi:hypothetical protein